MSQTIEGQKCPVCNAYLFEEDDIVTCPECGTPHHRDCYQFLGHCAHAELHGTERQFTPPVKAEPLQISEEPQNARHETVCGVCGEKIPENARMCPNCGAPQFRQFDGFASFDPLGGVPADMDIGDGVKAEEIGNFVAANARRYVPKFAQMTTGKRLSWNWLAFLFPSAWLLARKMYKIGALVLAVSVALTLFSFPLNQALMQYDFSNAVGFTEMAQTVAEHLPQIGNAVLIAAFVGAALQFVLRILIALFGDLMYRNYSITSIKRIKTDSEDLEESFHRFGGINLLTMILGIAIDQYLPGILSMFL